MKSEQDKANSPKKRRSDSAIVDVMIQVEQESCYRQLNWRWQLATLLNEGNRRFGVHQDPWLYSAVQFQRAMDADRWVRRSRRGYQFEAIKEAHALALDESRSRLLVEAYLLTDMPLEEIGNKASLSPAVIEAYEALFFQVRDRLKTGRGWVIKELYGYELIHQLPISFNQMFKWLGFMGGPSIVQTLHEAFPEDDLSVELQEADLASHTRVTTKIIFLTLQPGSRQLGLIRRWLQIRNLMEQKWAVELAKGDQQGYLQPHNVGLTEANAAFYSDLKMGSEPTAPDHDAVHHDMAPNSDALSPNNAHAA